MKCICCQGRNFRVRNLGVRDDDDDHREVSACEKVGYHMLGMRWDSDIYAHICNDCGYVMLFDRDKTEEPRVIHKKKDNN